MYNKCVVFKQILIYNSTTRLMVYNAPTEFNNFFFNMQFRTVLDHAIPLIPIFCLVGSREHESLTNGS